MGKINTSKIAGIILMVLCFFTLPAKAQYAGGTGDPCDPYQINDPCQLNTVGQHYEYLDKYFILTANIDMTGYSYGRAVIAPDMSNVNVGFDGIAFTGSFDGAGFVISNLTIDDNGASNDYIGLFGELGTGGEIKNLGLENVNVTGGTGSDALGGLVGRNYYGSISNCYVTGSVSGERYLGGLVGGNSYGNISGCYSTGSISGNGYLGGLSGRIYYGSISNCYATGTVSGREESQYLGGLVGCDWYGNISNCYATGSVSGGDISENLGGLIGANGTSGFQGGDISNCYATGSVSGGENSCYLGGLVGWNYGGSYTSSFWNIDDNPSLTGVGNLDPDPAGVIGETTANMQIQSTFTDKGWDFVADDVNGTDDIWRMCVDGVDYPKLSWQFLASDFVCPDGVDLIDFAVLTETWGLSSGQTGYKDLCDLMDDDMIDLADLAIFAENWLEGKM